MSEPYVTSLDFNSANWTIHELFDALRLYVHSEDENYEEATALDFLQWFYGMWVAARQEAIAESRALEEQTEA